MRHHSRLLAPHTHVCNCPQVLTTRAARGRLHGPPPAAPAYALLRVRLPEGLQLQGEFNPGEAVAAVFAWVSDCLADPGCTYELVLPSRRRLEAAGQAVRDVPELLPAATLNFRCGRGSPFAPSPSCLSLLRGASGLPASRTALGR